MLLGKPLAQQRDLGGDLAPALRPRSGSSSRPLGLGRRPERERLAALGFGRPLRRQRLERSERSAPAARPRRSGGSARRPGLLTNAAAAIPASQSSAGTTVTAFGPSTPPTVREHGKRHSGRDLDRVGAGDPSGVAGRERREPEVGGLFGGLLGADDHVGRGRAGAPPRHPARRCRSPPPPPERRSQASAASAGSGWLRIQEPRSDRKYRARLNTRETYCRGAQPRPCPRPRARRAPSRQPPAHAVGAGDQRRDARGGRRRAGTGLARAARRRGPRALRRRRDRARARGGCARDPSGGAPKHVRPPAQRGAGRPRQRDRPGGDRGAGRRSPRSDASATRPTSRAPASWRGSTRAGWQRGRDLGARTRRSRPI